MAHQRHRRRAGQVGTRRTRRQAHGNPEWLQRTMIAMVRCRSVADLIDLAYDAIRHGLGYDRVGLFLVNAAGFGIAPIHRHRRSRPQISPGGWCLESRRGSVSCPPASRSACRPMARASSSSAMRRAISRPRSAAAWMAGPRQNVQVALRTPERVLGLIAVDNLTSGRPITPADAPPLVAFAAALATAVENATLLEDRARRIEDLHGDLRQRVSELERLRAIERARAYRRRGREAAPRLPRRGQRAVCYLTRLRGDAAPRRAPGIAISRRLLRRQRRRGGRSIRPGRRGTPRPREGRVGPPPCADRHPPDLNRAHALAQLFRAGSALVVPTITDKWYRRIHAPTTTYR